MQEANPYRSPDAPIADPMLSGVAERQSLSELWISFEGRIPRRAYWLYGVLPAAVIGVVVVAIASLIHVQALIFLLQLIMIWPGLALQAKRWHDRDKSAWWILINFVPLIGAIWSFIEVGCLRGTDGPNRFGADPTGIY